MRLVFYPDPILLRPVAPVETFDDAFRERVAELRRLMVVEDGVGLAANQVGWDAAVLVAVPEPEAAESRVFVNPRVVAKDGGTAWGEEGCLSFPGIFGEVLRAKRVTIEAEDEQGSSFTEVAEGFWARVLQHEVDHLEGIPFVSKMRQIDKHSNKARIDELVMRHAERGDESRHRTVL